MKIGIVDYDVGNVRSIKNAFGKHGISASLTRKKDEILGCDGRVLPGVGAFAHGMNNLKMYQLVDLIHEFASSQKPLLGICLGMQILMEESEEFGTHQGLGLIRGKVVKLTKLNPKINKLPHISWNEIMSKNINWSDTILEKTIVGSNMYFVHSFVVVPENDQNILSTTNYRDTQFCSAVKHGNIYGCQFHPEKSADEGLSIIKNFINLCEKIKNE